MNLCMSNSTRNAHITWHMQREITFITTLSSCKYQRCSQCTCWLDIHTTAFSAKFEKQSAAGQLFCKKPLNQDLMICLSGATFHTPRSSLPVCLHPLCAESYRAGGTMASPTFPLSCREHSFVSCIPFPIHLFLSHPSWTEKKKKLLLLFTGGGVSKTSEWNHSP